jgi:hypothetical protein
MQSQLADPGASPHAPAPWRLKAQGHVLVLRRQGELSCVMLVDYLRSPVGPYRELLFMPNLARAPQQGLSIQKIYVSTMESVWNGRRNWGIPKELADFQVQAQARGGELWSVDVGGRCALRLALRPLPLFAPLATWLLPRRMRTLHQSLDGRQFTTAPSARALAQPARVLSAQVDAALFPSFSAADVLLALRVRSLRMVFPCAQESAR